jgi:hypothetical protein
VAWISAIRDLSKSCRIDASNPNRSSDAESPVVIGINIGIFFLLYRKQLKGAFGIERLPSAEQADLTMVAFAYVIASAIRWPLSLIALSGAVPLFIGGLCWRRTSLSQTAKRISWSIFGFIAGMFIVVRAIEDTGLTTLFGNWLVRLSGGTSFGAVIVGTVGAALGTNLINNRTDGCGDDLCFGRYPARIAGDPTRIRRSYDAAAQAHLKAPPKSDTKEYQNYAKGVLSHCAVIATDWLESVNQTRGRRLDASLAGSAALSCSSPQTEEQPIITPTESWQQEATRLLGNMALGH